MFADNFDKDKQAAKDLELAKQKEEEELMNLDEVIKWQFRWENKDDAEVHGPHTSEEMLKWQVKEKKAFHMSVSVLSFKSLFKYWS
jgi:CD2 antigen cytoplasmic tail-binding protein 2